MLVSSWPPFLAHLSHGRLLYALPATGYPIISHFLRKDEQTNQGGFNLGGINSTGQIPSFTGKVSLIDPDTPKEAMTIPGYLDPTQTFQLVFSDEFNADGRSFYPGDDPFWEAVDLHYWGTVDLEWYDPKQGTYSRLCEVWRSAHTV